MVVYERIAFNDACTYLGAKLCPCLGLSTDNGSDMRLEDAEYPVRACMGLCPEHLLLLTVHLEDGCQRALLVREQAFIVHLVLCKNVHQDANIFAQAVEHHGNSISHHLAFLLGFLDQLKIYLTGMTAVCAWLMELKRLADLYNIVGNLAAAVMDYIDVNGIAHLGIGTGGVHLQYSLVLTSLGIGEGSGIWILRLWSWRLFVILLRLFFLTPAFLLKKTLLPVEQSDCQFVEFFLRDSLAYRDEQAWVEYGLFGKLMQSAKVLHVGALLDDLDCLGIT